MTTTYSIPDPQTAQLVRDYTSTIPQDQDILDDGAFSASLFWYREQIEAFDTP